MYNENTIPSQLGPVDTMPSTLGAASGASDRREGATSTNGSFVKMLLLVAAVTVAAYLTR